MSKKPTKIPIQLLLILLVLSCGLLLVHVISADTNSGTLKKVQDQRLKEKQLYDSTP